MKRVRYILSILLIVSGYFIQAKEKNSSWMVTDREVYASGEYLLAKIFTPRNQNFKVVYLSLSSPDGNVITSVKLNITDQQTSGYLYLPDSLHTGSYLLNAYSSHYIKHDFFSKEIFVLNRFVSPDQELNVQRAVLPELTAKNENQVQVQGLNNNYTQREDVSIKLQLNDGLLSGLEGNLSVVVSECLPEWNPQYFPVNPDFDHAVLLSEYSGVVMQGVVKNSKTDKPVEGAIVYLTMPDSIPYFDYYRTAEDGRFYFLLKGFYGTHPLVVQAVKDDENENLKVQLDDQLSKDYLKTKVKPLELTKKEQVYFSNAISLATFKKVYHSTELEFSETGYNRNYSFPFYGKPIVHVDPDLYFEMSDFNEISKELLPPVRFRERKGQYTLNVIDRDMADFASGLPLILVDGVPVQRVEQIANMGSKDIDWIDVVPYQSLYGNLKFNGVLAIYTKELDASRIFPSDRVLKLNYETLQGKAQLKAPTDTDAHLPDFRQVLLWNPNLKAQDEISLNFKTSDIKGTFKLLVSAREKNGEITQSTFYFNVTE